MAERRTHGGGAGGEGRQVVGRAHVGGGEGEEHEGGRPREVDVIGRPVSLGPEGVEAPLVDVDEGDVVAGASEAPPGGGADHAGADDDDP